MHIGVVFPQVEIGADPGAIRDYAQAVEALEADQAALLDEATRLRDDRTGAVDDVAAALEHDAAVRIPWAAVGDEGEQRLAAAGLSVRCLLRGSDDVIVARAY